MSLSFLQANTLFYNKDLLSSTAWVWATFRVSWDLELGNPIETGWIEAFVVFKNEVQIERMLLIISWWVATIVKRGLQQDGVTENSLLRKDWNDWSKWYITVKPDDFPSTDKLDRSGWLRIDMGTAQNIWATNASTAITVADTKWWTNGASITGTGIPNGTTIVSFVPNTSAVLSANFTGTTGTVSVIVWRRQVLEIDANNNEVKKVIENGTVPNDTDTIYFTKSDWSVQELTYLEVRTALASAITTTFTGTTTDTLVTNNPVGIGYDGNIYNVPTVDRWTFTQIDWAWVGTYITQRYLWANTYLFWYMRGTTVYAKAWTLINNVWTYGTEVTIRTGMTANSLVVSALVNTNKVVLWWFETATSIGYIVCTVSWTTVSIWSVVTQSTWWTGTGYFTMDKIDTDRFIIAMNSGSDSRYMIGTVSGTVPSPWAYTTVGTHLWVKISFLANWYTWIMFQNSWTIAHRIIYSASGTTTTTTYTLADTSAVGGQWAICRFNDTSYAYYNWWTTVTKITIPWAGTTLVSSSLITGLSAIVNCDMCNIADSIFSLVSTTVWYMFQWSKILLTFSWISSIIVAWTASACNIISDWKYIMYFNSSSANGIPTYLSMLANQIIGAVQNNSTVILVNGALSIWTGIIPGSRYFSGNPLNNNPNTTNVPYAIWLSTTQLLIQ